MQICVPTVLEAYAGRGDMQVFDDRLDSWAKKALSLADATITCEGLENIEADENYVVMDVRGADEIMMGTGLMSSDVKNLPLPQITSVSS